MTADSKIIARVDRKRMLRREFMMDRVDSTPARRAAVRAALSRSLIRPPLCVPRPARGESGGSAPVSCPPDLKTQHVFGVHLSQPTVHLPKTHWVISSGK